MGVRRRSNSAPYSASKFREIPGESATDLAAVPATVDCQALQMRVQDLVGDDLPDVATAIHERDQFLGSRDV
jgi:hypothetical protein